MSFYKKAIPALSPVVRLIHRPEIHGLENIPDRGQGFILAPNHTNWFGWDALVISSALKDREIRWLSWSYESEYPGWNQIVQAFGCFMYNKTTPFPYREAGEYLDGGGIVGIFPEGNNNAMSTWYRLQRFFPGCVRLSAQAGKPIVPVSVAGLEETSPILWRKEEDGEPIKFFIALPVILPTKVIIRFGPPFDAGLSPDDSQDKDKLNRAADELRLEVLKLLKKDRPKAYLQI